MSKAPNIRKFPFTLLTGGTMNNLQQLLTSQTKATRIYNANK